MEAWEWLQLKTGGWSKELIVYDVAPRVTNRGSIKNGSSMFWEELIVSSLSYSSTCMMRLHSTWLQLELATRESRECVQLACEVDRLSESWLVDDGGWQRYILDSRLGLQTVISSCWMEGWVFIIGFLNHYGISSVGVEGSRAEGLGTCYADFSSLQPLQGGTHCADFLVLQLMRGGTLFETWGVSWSVRVEEEGKIGSLPFQETWTKHFSSWLMKSRSTNHSGILWHRWRKQVEKSSTVSPVFILRWEILS